MESSNLLCLKLFGLESMAFTIRRKNKNQQWKISCVADEISLSANTVTLLLM